MTGFNYQHGSNYITTESGEEISLDSNEGFKIISKLWLRSGWDSKYVYSFTWLGRPIIQLPEDMLRIQELIYSLKPDVIVETGIAHGGSLIYYASLFELIGKGRVIGVDIDIRSHNKKAIMEHKLSSLIKMIEGSSISDVTFELVKNEIGNNEKTLVILDSNHTKNHVLKELQIYSQLVPIGGYIVACDGIMKQVAGAPRTEVSWTWDNPLSAIDEFLKLNVGFKLEEPNLPFNEGKVTERVTYWPNAFIKRIS